MGSSEPEAAERVSADQETQALTVATHGRNRRGSGSRIIAICADD
jgi:hypothetical protein